MFKVSALQMNKLSDCSVPVFFQNHPFKPFKNTTHAEKSYLDYRSRFPFEQLEISKTRNSLGDIDLIKKMTLQSKLKLHHYVSCSKSGIFTYHFPALLKRLKISHTFVCIKRISRGIFRTQSSIFDGTFS